MPCTWLYSTPQQGLLHWPQKTRRPGTDAFTMTGGHQRSRTLYQTWCAYLFHTAPWRRDASIRLYIYTMAAPLALSQQAVLRVYAPPPDLLVVDLSGDLLGTNNARDTRAWLCTPLSPTPSATAHSPHPKARWPLPTQQTVYDLTQ